MTEIKQIVSCEHGATEFKKNSETFIYIWKISNFRDIYKEDQYTTLSSKSTPNSNHDSGETALWSIILNLRKHPGLISSDYFCVDVNFYGKTEKINFDYFKLKVSALDACNGEKEWTIFNEKSISASFYEAKKDLLSDTREFLPNGDLTLKFQVIFTKCELFSSNPNPTNFSNMLTQSTGVENMLNNEKFSDVKIAVGDKKYYGHKVILASRSPVFAAMFEHNMKENIENIIEIKDIDHKIMHEILHFMYTGKVKDIEDTAYDLLPAADKYEIEVLKLICEETLIKQLKVENVISFLAQAEKHGAKQLKESALQYFKLHGKEIVQTEAFEKELNNCIHVFPDICKILVA